jgi:hypothetical protein
MGGHASWSEEVHFQKCGYNHGDVTNESERTASTELQTTGWGVRTITSGLQDVITTVNTILVMKYMEDGTTWFGTTVSWRYGLIIIFFLAEGNVITSFKEDHLVSVLTTASGTEESESRRYFKSGAFNFRFGLLDVLKLAHKRKWTE